jgi:hypothetical protein
MKNCRFVVVLTVGLICSGLLGSDTHAPVVLRVGHFTVTPSTGPVVHVFVKNQLDQPYQGTVRVQWPAGWRADPLSHAVSMNPLETKRLAFVLEKATDLAANLYPVEIVTEGNGARTVHKQDVMCTSAPFYKPKIDGKDKDWVDAIGVTCSYRGKKTIIKTFWNQKQFCLLVEVEEDKLNGYRKKVGTEGIDAIRFSLYPKGANAGDKPSDQAQRYEFLVAASVSRFSSDKCFLLLKHGDPLSLTQDARDPTTLICKAAQVVVKRNKKTTLYECAIPSALIPKIRLGVGREIGFALLVHDADGTGVRDWKETLGLWTQPNPFAWSTCTLTPWSDYIPHTNKIVWGLCSSKH